MTPFSILRNCYSSMCLIPKESSTGEKRWSDNTPVKAVGRTDRGIAERHSLTVCDGISDASHQVMQTCHFKHPSQNHRIRWKFWQCGRHSFPLEQAYLGHHWGWTRCALACLQAPWLCWSCGRLRPGLLLGLPAVRTRDSHCHFTQHWSWTPHRPSETRRES